MLLNNQNLAYSQHLKINLNVEKYQLKNGLTVLLHQDRNIPMISYHTWYRVGSRDEGPGITGAAHMLEHMMFKGAQKYSGKDFDRILHENGIVNNAFTSWDYTGFFENLPSHRLELIMDVEVDRMRFLKIDPQDLMSELKVVGEERRWRIDNNPRGLLNEMIFSLIFAGSPYEWPVIGYMKDIESYTSEKLRYFYDTFYVPNNAVLVLAGSFDIEATKKLIEKYYEPLPSKPLPERKYVPPRPIQKPIEKIVKKDVQAPTAFLAYQSATIHEKDQYALEILGNILGGGRSSRLYKELVYEKEMVTSVYSFQWSQEASGLFGIYVSLKPGKSYKEIQQICHSQIKDIQEKGVSDIELEKAKNQIMKDFVDQLKTLDGRARILAQYEILFGSYQRVFKDLEEYHQVTHRDVMRVAKKYLNPEAEVLGVLVP